MYNYAGVVCCSSRSEPENQVLRRKHTQCAYYREKGINPQIMSPTGRDPHIFPEFLWE